MQVRIGKQWTPSKVLEEKVTENKAITISWGGGMGGSSLTLYTTKIDRSGEFWIISLIDGTEIELNPVFVVKIENVKVAKQVLDLTSHKYYKSGLLTTFIRVNINANVTFGENGQDDLDIIQTINNAVSDYLDIE